MQASKYFKGWNVDTTLGCYSREGQIHFGCKNKHTGYSYFKQNLMHRCIWAEANGRWPLKGMHVGHLDDVRTNNQIANLKEMTPSENNKSAAKNRVCKMRRDKPRAVKATCLATGETRDYPSQSACAKDLSLNQGIVSAICNKYKYSKTGRSKKDGSRWTFSSILKELECLTTSSEKENSN